jgi:DNA polymerase III subunit gamma/tau
VFENILGHDQLVDQLSHSIATGSLPATILFGGPKFSGKLTTALELARAITCEKDGSWSCRCGSCLRQRALVHPETLLVGNRDFLPEIRLSRDALLRQPQPATLYLFLRSVRKLVRRFDSTLWEGDEQRIAKVTAVLNDVEEELRGIDSQGEIPPIARLEEVSTQVVSQVEDALRHAPSDLAPIAVVRNIAFWARIAPSGRARIVIIEDAEGLNAASRNAMLKILEEPPPSVHFVLTSERSQAVIDTIRSRARLYTFSGREMDTERAVVKRIFRDSDVDSTSLREYFLTQAGGYDRHTVAELAGQAAALFSESPGWDRYAKLEPLAETIEKTLDRNGYPGFFEELMSQMAAGAPEQIGDVMYRRRLSELISEAAHRSDVLNMSMLNVLEDLLYKLEHNAEVY